MGLFGWAKKKDDAGEKSEKSEKRGRFALRSSASLRASDQRRTSAGYHEASAPATMGTVFSVKAAAQAKASKPSRRTSQNDAPLLRPPLFLASPYKLGTGAYGAVLLGSDVSTGGPVAIKFIADGRMKPASLEREVAMLRRLSTAGHPALLKFHAHLRPEEVRAGDLRATDENQKLPLQTPLDHCHALVMEACRGGELFEHVVANDGLEESESAPIFGQLVDAVRAAHVLGIAHRDLKLENVLLCGSEGAPDSRDIKLIDWGLAHQHAFTPDGRVVAERLRSRCGSRSYMAPEVTNRALSSTRGYDGFLADVWSLGVCLFAIHLGFFPFEQADPEVDWRARRVLEAQARGESSMATIFSFYPHKPLSLSSPLLALLDRMLLFEPAARATLSEVVSSSWLAPHVPPPCCSIPVDLRHSRASVETNSSSSTSGSGASSRRASLLDSRGDCTLSCTQGSRAAPSTIEPVGMPSAQPTNEATASGGGQPVRVERQDSTSTAYSTRIERQDSSSTAVSIASSVGSSVVQSVARLRAFETGGRADGRVRRFTRDYEAPGSPVREAPETEQSRWDAVRYAVASSSKRERSARRRAMGRHAQTDLKQLSALMGQARVSQVNPGCTRRSGNA